MYTGVKIQIYKQTIGSLYFYAFIYSFLYIIIYRVLNPYVHLMLQLITSANLSIKI